MTQTQTQEQVQTKATGELLLAGFVKNVEFEALINTYNISSDTVPFILLENQPRRVIASGERQKLLHFARFDLCFDFTPYTSGRIFHQFGELRWERQQQRTQIVYTGKKEYKPELEQSIKKLLDEVEWQERYYILFGKRLDDKQLDRIGSVAKQGDFAEVRIPRLLRYPPTDLPTKVERVQLVVCEYLNPDTGANIAYRFKGLVPYEKPKEQKKV